MRRLELAHTLVTLHAGQIYVHQDHVGKVFGDFLDRGFAVGIFAGEFESARAFDEGREAAADAFVVIHDGHFDLHK